MHTAMAVISPPYAYNCSFHQTLEPSCSPYSSAAALPRRNISPKVSSFFRIPISISRRRNQVRSASLRHLRHGLHFASRPAAAGNSSDEVITEQEATRDYYYGNVAQIKQQLFAALQGINRGIFGVPSEKKTEIENLVDLLESQNPTPQPTLRLEKTAGTWKLLYSTITILGSKRTKLGLRDFITLGDFLQSINVAEGKAVNVIKFSAKGLNLLSGQLTIEASFKIASESLQQVSDHSRSADECLLLQNYDLLLHIFNPEGWLEITYVDDFLRIGRDDKEIYSS